MDADRIIADLREENRSLREVIVETSPPLVEFVRYVAPFIRDAIAAGLWAGSMGVESVEHQTAHTLSWLDRLCPPAGSSSRGLGVALEDSEPAPSAAPAGSRLSSPAGGSVSPEDPEGKNQ